MRSLADGFHGRSLLTDGTLEFRFTGSSPLSWPPGPHKGGATEFSFVEVLGVVNTFAAILALCIPLAPPELPHFAPLSKIPKPASTGGPDRSLIGSAVASRAWLASLVDRTGSRRSLGSTTAASGLRPALKATRLTFAAFLSAPPPGPTLGRAVDHRPRGVLGLAAPKAGVDPRRRRDQGGDAFGDPGEFAARGARRKRDS